MLEMWSVIVLDEEGKIDTNDLFMGENGIHNSDQNVEKMAQNEFYRQCRVLKPELPEDPDEYEDIDDLIDEGYFAAGNIVVMLSSPNIK